eukprot:TRINITY_DN1155_c0_g1_i11.p1 TRINITY_DN1155_c0_g1~~TRINITY_DN1155_c0_g1_i11.p1  ORF type:complete len:455 (+),score=123.75 TRINITY_DN1155_c0_g1_i11:504-1868(+)
MELMTKVKELELENKDLKSKLQANIDYNEKNALVLGEKVISIHVLVQRDRQLAAHAGGLEGRACSGKEGQAGACAVSAWLSECRKVLALSNDNRELISNLMSVKNEVAEKMNQANEIYNKALGVMEANSKQAVGGTKSSEKLDEYMLSSLSAPLASTIPEKPKFKISAHNQEALAVRYDNFGNSLATCGGDNLVKVWDPATGKEISRFKDFTKPVTCLDYNLDGNLICAGSVDKTIRVLDLKTQRSKHCFTGHSDTINSLSTLLRSAKIVSGSSDRTIKLWDYEKMQVSLTTNYPSATFSVDVAQDDNMLVTGHNNGTLVIWSINKFGKVIEFKDLHRGEVISSVCISRDSYYVLTNGRDNILKLIDLRKYDVVKEFTDDQYTNTSNTNRACLSTDSKFVLVGGNAKVLLFKDDGEVDTVYEDGHQTRVLGTDWEPRGSQFATVDAYGGLIIWE